MSLRRAQARAEKIRKTGRIVRIVEGSQGYNSPTKEVTDRALRYRANRTPPAGERRCAFCGARNRTVEVGHVDGHEEHSERRNLIWTCRACNTKTGKHFRRIGAGRPTRQYNPARRRKNADSGASSIGQWLIAVSSMKGESDAMTVPAAVAMIHATPAARRSEFAKRIWALRRQRGTDRIVPF